MVSVTEDILSKGHEQVSVFQDRETGLTSIIAVHNTSIGPALGGCRMRPYQTLEAALQDVLNLSEAMSFKNSLCGISFGGGKSVILADSSLQEGRAEFFQQFGRFLDTLGGRYITAEDMGTNVSDMMEIAKTTQHVAGRDPQRGGAGDPSPWTALGVFEGIQATLGHVFQNESLSGRHVAVQGVGHVGTYLVRRLVEAGARVTLTDIATDRATAFAKEVGAAFVEPEAIITTECDVFAPCAAGGAINEKSVRELRCKIVAGAANNQIAGNATEALLHGRGIYYAPDFAINAGGVILCADEFEPGGFQSERVSTRVHQVRGTVARILAESSRTGELAGEVAVRLARERIFSAR